MVQPTTFQPTSIEFYGTNGPKGDFLENFNQSLQGLQSIVQENQQKSKNLGINQINLLQRLGAIALSLKELSNRFPEFKKVMDQQKDYIDGLTNDLQKKDQEMADFNSKIEQLRQEKQALETEMVQNQNVLQEMKSSQEAEMQKTSAEMDALRQEYTNLQQRGDERSQQHQEEIARSIQEKQDELAKMKEEHDDLLRAEQGNREKLEQEKSSVSNNLQVLMQEKEELKKENDQLVENIKNATMIIHNVVNKLQKIAQAKDLSIKFSDYYEEIEQYIKLISNALQGATLSGGRLRKRGKRGTRKSGKKSSTRKVRNTKKRHSTKKYGGFVYKKHKTLKFSSRHLGTRR